MSDDLNGAAGANSGNQDQFNESELPKFSELDPANLTPEQAASLIKAGQTLLGQSKHWKGKAIDPETGKPFSELYKETKKTPQQGPNPQQQNSGAQDADLRKDVDGLKMTEEKRQFGHKNSLTPEETDNLFAFANGMGLKPADALTHPFFKSGIEAMRQQDRQAGATPGPSRRAPIVEGKTFEEMNKDEKRKNFGKVVESAQKVRR